MDKTKTFQKLTQAHDTLYTAIEALEDIKIKGEMVYDAAERLSHVLTVLDEAEKLLNQAVDSPYWRRENKGEN